MIGFREIRSLPAPNAQGSPDFFRYDFPSMKSLVTTAGTALAGGGFTTVATISVPAQGWFPSKVIIVRLALSELISGLGGPAVANIREQFLSTGGTTWAIPNPGPASYSNGNSSAWREFRFIRMDPNLIGVDFNQSMAHGAPNSSNGTSYVNTIPPSGGGFNFANPITLSYQINVPALLMTSSVAVGFLQGLIEQGTNLGKIY